MPKYLTYRRLSKQEKLSKSCGLEWQLETVTQWLSQHGCKPLADFVDDGVSGAVPIRDRKAGKLMMAEAQKVKGIILVAKTDRLFRSLTDMAASVDAWKKQGVSLISVTEGYDFTTIAGRMMLGMLCVFGQAERETISERTTAAAQMKKRQGKKWTRDIPYGFRMEGGELGSDGIQRGGLIVPDDGEQIVIKKIKALRTAGQTLRAIAKKLNEAGIPTRRGGLWIHTMVQHIIQTFRERTHGTARSGAGGR